MIGYNAMANRVLGVDGVYLYLSSKNPVVVTGILTG
jgi:hypothetical protein